MKNFFQSKLNWLGIAAAATAVSDFITNYNTSTWDWKTVTLFILGIGTVIIRTYFTSKTIS